MGLDSVWAVEHHFTDYTLCPDIPQFLAFMAGQTKTIKLGTATIILPWHKYPIRVATSIAMLDILAKGPKNPRRAGHRWAMDINCIFSFAGMPYDYVKGSMKLLPTRPCPRPTSGRRRTTKPPEEWRDGEK